MNSQQKMFTNYKNLMPVFIIKSNSNKNKDDNMMRMMRNPMGSKVKELNAIRANIL